MKLKWQKLLAYISIGSGIVILILLPIIFIVSVQYILIAIIIAAVSIISGVNWLADIKKGEKNEGLQPPPLEKYQKPPKEKPRELTPDGMRDKSKEGRTDE